MITSTPPAEVAIDVSLVRELLAEQHPDLAQLALFEIEAGWDNAMFRLGDELVVRLPRRLAAAQLVTHEQRWLPHLVAQLPLPIPAPLRVGVPSVRYPWHWSVVPWLHGQTADLEPLLAAEADRFAMFLRALHVPAPADAPLNPVRGGLLSQRAPFTNERLARLTHATDLITPEIERIWQDALAAPIDVAPTWLHGDLHPRNVLVEQGAISGIIDWGDITAGDCATDLAAIWTLFAEPAARRQAFIAYGALSDATLRRARGWAVLFGAVLLDTGLVDNPRNARIGENILRRLGEKE